MQKTYKIKKILNNNVVSALDGFQEVIVVGMGVGFNTKVHQVIPPEKIEKIFVLKRDDFYKTSQLVNDIAEETFYQLVRLIESVSHDQKQSIDEHGYMTLVDHLNFAMERHNSGFEITNFMVHDLRVLYPEQFEFSEILLKRVNEAFKIALPYDEIGFLTMHVVNGTQDIGNQSSILTDLVFSCLNAVRDTYLTPLKMEDLVTQRIMIHIKMLIQRVMSDKQVDFNEVLLYNVIKEFDSAYKCAQIIQGIIESRLKKTIKQQELVYLTIHLNRLEMILADK